MSGGIPEVKCEWCFRWDQLVYRLGRFMCVFCWKLYQDIGEEKMQQAFRRHNLRSHESWADDDWPD